MNDPFAIGQARALAGHLSEITDGNVRQGRIADLYRRVYQRDPSPQELQMAESLISNLSSDFDPQDYTDDYREAMQQRIDDKLQGGQGFTPSEQEGDIADSDTVVDLMTALRASVDRTSSGGEQDVPSQRSTTNRAAADMPRKSPAS